jgi:hypothetical protein
MPPQTHDVGFFSTMGPIKPKNSYRFKIEQSVIEAYRNKQAISGKQARMPEEPHENPVPRHASL